MILGTLATNPQRCVGRSRATGLWISPHVADGDFVVLDTRAVAADRRHLAGPDAFPPDAVLVVVSPATCESLRQIEAALPAFRSGPLVAAEMVDSACADDATLAARIDWRTVEQ